ncbi:MAG: hypothetical protein OXU20_30025 [Myxococcales bacterium]|nr:hypothetical protein [Myxococcales bacterium]MDD9969505.1 hypothetical protein [Myxococcales bacterium]
MGCASENADNSAAPQVSALSEAEYHAFCEESVDVLSMSFDAAGASEGTMGCQDGASGLEVSSAAGCKNAPAPDCSRDDVNACLDALAEDPCAIHAAAGCEAFVACASEDGTVTGLDYLIRYLADPPENGPGFGQF